VKLDYRVERRHRVLGHDEFAERMREDPDGLTVGEVEPNVTDAVLYVDDETGEPILANLPLPGGVADLRRAVTRIKFGETVRQSTGKRNKSRTFGMAPRKLYQKRESCRPTALASDQPAEHQVLVDLAVRLGGMMEALAPEVYLRDRETMTAVEDEWRIAEGSTWTSGVVNKTSTLPYHTDGFNFRTWSVMPVVRRGTRGGHLHLPEYDLAVECRDGWTVSFCGFDLWHGVSPIRLVEPDGYRITIVYYSLRGMKDCFTAAVESAEGARRRTAREDALAAAIRGDEALRFQP
jgi:hypothetical protein